jgi:hypothetical protein
MPRKVNLKKKRIEEEVDEKCSADKFLKLTNENSNMASHDPVNNNLPGQNKAWSLRFDPVFSTYRAA